MAATADGRSNAFARLDIKGEFVNLKSLLSLALVCGAIGAVASDASAADLSVKGQIQPAGACSLALSNAGVIDVGELSRQTLSKWNAYRDMSLAINCASPTKVAIKVVDNREGSTFFDAWLGLGTLGIGSYVIRGDDKKGNLDGKRPITLTSWDGGSSWNDGSGGLSNNSRHGSPLTSWGNPDHAFPRFPVAFQTLTAALQVEVYIHTPALDFQDEIALDGSATLELVYL
ncbi:MULTISPECIES: DUF1120 domain-containing protein [Burkholderia]|jgi:hypothetical protein|uniref:DUF1120 domain-containing protein n=2 Tax=Burkholderia contaminans TaxID=488447 RepID=A0AAP1VBY3_9BURK|nr:MULTISPECIES: DUF1120 domain-containing protein [Burkholderia]UTP27047.1 DUF1120 domain-containing protein [Burkholderia sp. FXe9]KKL42817.1 hypothetical protein WR31_13145 [Burkholderia contaminans LMG 23361]MBA9834595.1 DUF1120 domain-containing protein [Burkholderia contaminans]MBA9842477.1 DUF1120 domain-containing protein [Burkholderia contaminans]MBA9867363.1 DUF1120 domain-containing protein [Burkholderia contaminans]